MSSALLLRTLTLIFLFLNVARANPVITEFMADNVSFSADEDGAYSDWIEIHNPGAAPLVLTDWALTDDAANLTKWKFPAVTVQPGEFLVVWASAKNKRTPELPLHTNFSLSKKATASRSCGRTGQRSSSNSRPRFRQWLRMKATGCNSRRRTLSCRARLRAIACHQTGRSARHGRLRVSTPTRRQTGARERRASGSVCSCRGSWCAR